METHELESDNGVTSRIGKNVYGRRAEHLFGPRARIPRPRRPRFGYPYREKRMRRQHRYGEVVSRRLGSPLVCRTLMDDRMVLRPRAPWARYFDDIRSVEFAIRRSGSRRNEPFSYGLRESKTLRKRLDHDDEKLVPRRGVRGRFSGLATREDGGP